MDSECSNGKRRLHIALSLDNPLQRETWLILSQAKNKTNAVCEAVCGHHRQKNLEDTLRAVIQEELKHISVPQATDHEENTETDCDADILDFLQALQNE